MRIQILINYVKIIYKYYILDTQYTYRYTIELITEGHTNVTWIETTHTCKSEVNYSFYLHTHKIIKILVINICLTNVLKEYPTLYIIIS